MKTNLKRVSKRSLALILGILMLFSTLMVGSITTNAEGSSYYMHWGNKDSEYNNLLEMPSSGANTYSANLSVTQSKDCYIKINNSSSDNNVSSIDSNTQITDNTNGKFHWCQNGSFGIYRILKFSPKVSFNLNITYNPVENTITLSEGSGGSTGGGDTPTYKLMKNNQEPGKAGTEAATFTGSGDTYTATYDITTTGKHYFYVRDNNNKDYLNSSKTFVDNEVSLYKYNDTDYTHSIELDVKFSFNCEV